MKKIIFAIAIIFAAISFSSCTIKNDKAELDIKRVVGKGNVCGNIKIKTLDVIDGKFYQYTEEYDRTCKNQDFYNLKVKDAQSHYQWCIDYIDRASFSKKLFNEGIRMMEEAESDIEKYKFKADSCYNHIQNLQHTKIRGTLYVARYYSNNKFGVKKKVHDYKVFTYNDNGNIHEYKGEDRLEIILSVYPKAGEEYTKQLQNIGAIGI